VPPMKTILLSFVAISAVAAAQSVGTFIVGANMTSPRTNHTATLLADGTVLIAGFDASGFESADLYDPVAGTIVPIGSMLIDSQITATVLADGRVLLAGTIAQLYDPTTRTFAAVGSGLAIHGCAATLLGNGKVLFTEDPPPYGPSATAELFDPDTGAFLPTGPYASIDIAQFDYAVAPSYGGWDCRRAILLADGRVLVAGGVAAEIYDPRTNTFSLTGTMTQYPNGFKSTLPAWGDPSRAILLLDGMVLFSGGDGDLGPSTEAWLYSPSTGAFVATGNMTTARARNTTTLLPDGTGLAAGARAVVPPQAYGAIDSAELYSPAAATFSTAGEMITPRFGHTATLLTNGRVLITGGTTDDDASPNGLSALSTTELYSPTVLVPAPALFSLSGDGKGQGAIWHATTGQIASASSPAVAGDVLSTYTTSLFEDGVIPPQIAVGDRLAEILFFGDAPGYPGYFQVNFRVPGGVVPGSAVSVALTYIGRPSNAVTMGVQ
jgi:hypothetical protein